MTVKDMIGLALRRWYVFAVAVACASLSIVALNSSNLVFVAQTEFVMVAPGASADFDAPGETRETLVAFADVVVRQLNADDPTEHLSSPSSSMFGNGIRHGVSARLSDSGTQWKSAFQSPVISVQVVDSSDRGVQQQLDAISTRIVRITHDIQQSSGAKPSSFIHAATDPTRIVISSFGPTRTSKIKAYAVLTAVSLCISMIIAVGMDQRVSRRQRNGPPSSNTRWLPKAPRRPRQESVRP